MNIEAEIKSTVKLSITKKVMLNLTFTRNFISDKFSELLKPYEISSEQYNVLRILRGQKGKHLNMQDIQERMITKNSNTTRLIDKLLLKDMVKRNTCPNNRRKIEVNITQKGLDVLSELDPIIEEHDKIFTKNLSNLELEQLNNLLEKLREI
ncbi:MarR family transcriptional regulator [Flavobacterium sp. 316]|uniref:MarR family transcriptional regulator n=1 Tax=Flavobacterium sediminilitoris TaxID=2024526 RepID=A0ABY4HKG1_9FLAO|nr:MULTISPECIES: MarR family transcriptional regulator [Flavobacterium]KIX22751.1 MarR family transcriptional regulator [Flavobacterium sp. 316]UOX33345.1 MarR family transcriptional regulator [Flavobacterium sediminilitoris]